MAIDHEAIRGAIVAQIRDAAETAVNWYPYLVNDPQFPCVTVRPGSPLISYHESFDTGVAIGGMAHLIYEVHVAETGNPEDAGPLIDSFLGTASDNSIIKAIESDRTLGGLVADCVCRVGDYPRPPGDVNTSLNLGVVRLFILAEK